ncbi:MAG: c-type cytochrome, partial [Rhodoferax sp.]|nr:c-type cytochrome [Rhodoferax sp.]
MAERTRACTHCHGPQGLAGPDGYYPRLAGKPANYLYGQLLHFRDGRRHYPLMRGLLEPLSDAYLMEMAVYFSRLELPYPPASRSLDGGATWTRGRDLVLRGDPQREIAACASCHGERLTGALPGVPGLLGLPRDYITAQLGAWKSGMRRAHEPDCMADVARRLSAADVNAIAHWLSSQPVPQGGPNPVSSVATRACGRPPVPATDAKAPLT